MKTGSLVFMTIDDLINVGETSSSFTQDANMIEVSNKLSGRDTNIEYGRLNRTFTVNNIADTDPNVSVFGIKEALDAQAAGTKVTVKLTSYTDKTVTTKVEGDVILSGEAIITNVSWEAADDSAQTFSMTLQIDGVLTSAVNPDLP